MRFRNPLFTGTFCIIFCCSFFSLYAQQKAIDFATEWKKIDDFINKGLTKSALTEVNKIYYSAKKNINDPQIIKSLLYKITLNENIEEDAALKNIDTLEAEIKTAKEPAKSILQSITAQMYWNYFQQNRYNLYQRTNTINFNKTDIATWTTDDLHKKITELYLSSLKDEKLLQQTKLEQFDPILIKGNARYLRPTLYDLLAHEALEYFKSDERDITRPAYAFEIKDKQAFAVAIDFIKYGFVTKDSLSLHQKALLIFKSLLKFHLDDAKPDALIDADIERINFVNEYGVMDNKDSLYVDALKNVAEKYSSNPLSAQASFLVAETIYNKALQASKNDESAITTYTVTRAKEMLDIIAKKFPESEGGINARNLINQIIHPEIKLTTEKVNVPQLPFRTLVTYKNFNTVYFRLIELSPQLKKDISGNYDNDLVFQKLTTQQSLKNWKQNLPATNDYLSHSTEVKIDALPVGEYALLGSSSADFSLIKNPLAVQYFYVSNISFINSELRYFILDRTSGHPLSGAKVTIYKQQYGNNSTASKIGNVTADKNGYFDLPLPKKDNNNNIRLDITYKNDKLFLDDAQYIYNYYNDNKDDDYESQKEYDEENAKVFLFTDRSIYRPGQLVYFKGIGVTKDFKIKKSKLLESKDSITVILSDATSQQIDSVKVLLNDYGSFNGKFYLPENKLNGDFHVEVTDYENSSVGFSVEEYKRPKFYTEFEKLKGIYRVGDTVSITGFAKAYAGNNIDGANVKYHVTRQARFLYPWMFWRKGFPRTSSLEITNGEISTDAYGKFIIKFAAIPDLSLDKKTDPVFDYKVEADVTDINGETRSGNVTVPVGYKSLDLQITLPQGDVVNIDSLKDILISSKNLSGELKSVKADVNIYKLQTPERLIRQRFWDKPDKFIMTKDEYIQNFPHDEYMDETQKETWSKGEMVYEQIDSTNTKIQIENPIAIGSKFQQGWYVIEATAKDKDEQQVKDIKYFQVYDSKATSLPALSYVWNFTQNNSVEPGDTGHVITGTSAKNIFIIEDVDKIKTNYKATSQINFSYLNNDKKISDFKISEDDRGGFGVNHFFVKDDRFYTNSSSINVPWTNKDLNISFDTYRDKTLPGSDEKWKVKINGYKGEKVAAEMLASMYDASLDQFKEHSWSTIDIWPTYSGYNSWAGVQNFSSVQSIEKYWVEKYVEQKEKTYDVLNYLSKGNYLLGRLAGVQIRRNSSINSKTYLGNTMALNDVVVVGYGSRQKDLTGAVSLVQPKVIKDEEATKTSTSQKQINRIDQSQIQIRKNFSETAFFFPELRTDKDGNIEFNFTMPEALTQWKLVTLAHTKDLASGYATKTIVTQKDLMIQPNAPRFLREGDSMEFTAKIVNLIDKEVSGQAELHLSNASKMNSVDEAFKNIIPSESFTAKAGQSTLVKFSIKIPLNFNDAVVYRIVAKAGNVSDGEEAAIPGRYQSHARYRNIAFANER